MPNRTIPKKSLGATTFDIVTVDEYRGMKRGDKVNVYGDNSKKLPGRFEFHSYQVNVRSGKAWINVHGGVAARAVLWPYAINQVRIS